MAVSLPPFIQPATLNGRSWWDGGIVDIFPVHPVLDIEAPVDTAIAVNCFYPSGFAGEDVSGWDRQPLSVLRVGSQIRTSQQVQLARENLARLRSTAKVLLVEPVPYQKVAGTGFYQQFMDSSQWPQFMITGRTAALAVVRSAAAHDVTPPTLVRRT